MDNEELMHLAVIEARKTMNENKGGPFGALITDKKGNIICITTNTVLETNDPTAHAEINAIREASKILGTRDLRDCILYATGYPCPMCLGAIIWANIKKVYYSGTLEDAKTIDFKDDDIYDFIKGANNLLDLENISNEEAVKLYKEYEEKNKTIY